MKTLFLKRLSDSFRLSAVMAAIPLFIEFVCGFKFDVAFFGVIFMGAFFLSAFSSMKTSWYLALPLSRKKLLQYHLLECVIVAGMLLLMLAVSAFLILHHEHEKLDGLFVLLFMAPMVAMIGCLGVIKPASHWAMGPTALNRLDLRFWTALLKNRYVVASIIAILLIAFLQDGWLIAIFFIATLSSIPKSTLKTMAYPKSSLDKIQRVFTACGMVVSLSIILVAYAVVNLARPDSIYPSLALQFLGHLPTPVSKARAEELFQSPWTKKTRASMAIFQSSDFSVTSESWKRKVGQCFGASCLELADRISPSGQTAPEKDLSRFEVMIEECHFRLNDESKVRCSLAKLPRKSLDRWLSVLVTSPELNNWLSSSEVTLQITALKVLTFEALTPEQKDLIKTLTQSEDKFVRSAAIDNLSFDRARLAKGKPSAALLF